MTEELLEETIKLLTTLKTDAKWALTGKWAVDYQNNESMEGFETQIELINKVLPQLKKLRNDR